MNQPPSIIIAGAGLGGFQAFLTLKKLLKASGLPHVITLINDAPYYTFVPMLHEVATGSVDSEHVKVDLNEQTKGTPHRFLQARVEHVNLKERTVTTNSGLLSYDFIIIALGSGINFFSTPGAPEHAKTVRTLSQALETRSKLLNLIKAKPAVLNATVIGGGFTGVEITGQLGDFCRKELKRRSPHSKLNVHLIEAGPAVLGSMPLPVQKLVSKRLKNLNIDVRTNERVKSVNAQSVVLANGTELPSDLTIWSAGVANVATNFLSEVTTEKGCVLVDEFLRIKGMDNAFAIGDIAWGCNPNSNTPFPQLGEVAFHEGTFIAQHLVDLLKGQSVFKPFIFTSKGTLLPIGDWYGIAKLGNLLLSGCLAWWMRRTVYLLYMPTFSKKIQIIKNWIFRTSFSSFS